MFKVIETREINGEEYRLVCRSSLGMSSLFFQSVDSYISTDEGEVARSSRKDWIVSDLCFFNRYIDVSMHNNDSLEEKMKNIENAIAESTSTEISSYF